MVSDLHEIERIVLAHEIAETAGAYLSAEEVDLLLDWSSGETMAVLGAQKGRSKTAIGMRLRRTREKIEEFVCRGALRRLDCPPPPRRQPPPASPPVKWIVSKPRRPTRFSFKIQVTCETCGWSDTLRIPWYGGWPSVAELIAWGSAHGQCPACLRQQAVDIRNPPA